jgi:hypothetical protein
MAADPKKAGKPKPAKANAAAEPKKAGKPKAKAAAKKDKEREGTVSKRKESNAALVKKTPTRRKPAAKAAADEELAAAAAADEELADAAAGDEELADAAAAAADEEPEAAADEAAAPKPKSRRKASLRLQVQEKPRGLKAPAREEFPADYDWAKTFAKRRCPSKVYQCTLDVCCARMEYFYTHAVDRSILTHLHKKH